jgi:hypothetical protein
MQILMNMLVKLATQVQLVHMWIVAALACCLEGAVRFVNMYVCWMILSHAVCMYTQHALLQIYVASGIELEVGPC